ncbi:hypothetical protein FNV43_RR17352 [Rhamnella rubrinervis]|uniref:Uncharacterized protein n=1 Tax=Rhamnella rubrinervis TaxID=2594499 RepID=A0A8K0GRU4_9ROSA|nr:hypothetical protein FNV43_RR17352 [Rhamnella rubrinervis]
MSRQEKRRKFNDAVLNTLFPPPPQKKHNHGMQPKDEDEPLGIQSEGFNADDLFPDDELGKIGSSTTSDDDDGGGGDDTDCGTQKLTRAQRKRLRIKKLKEDASRRNKIIGPLLPPANHDEGDSSVGGGARENDHPPCVRRNSAEEPPIGVTSSNSANHCSKLKQRRMAKRVAKKKPRGVH